MKKRTLFVTLLGILLCGGIAYASHVGFTINGQPGYYECSDPCTVKVADPDGGTDYQWDFDYASHPSFTVQVTGNPVSWTYHEPGDYTIAQSTDGGQTISTGGVRVIPSEDSAPEDIEMLSPASGPVPRVLEFTTSRPEMDFGCGFGDCEMEFVERTQPGGSSRPYHHFLRLDDGKPSFELDTLAYSSGPAYAVRETFTITVTGQTDLFKARKARWRGADSGSRCIVKFKQRFRTSYDYEAKLSLVAKEPGLRVHKTVRKAGDEGGSRIRGKLSLHPEFVDRLPSRATAKLKVVVAGKPYRDKTKFKVQEGCR